MRDDAPGDGRQATRAGRRRRGWSDWLVSERGSRYSLGELRRLDAVGFHVHYQDGEGRLWRRVNDRAGNPVVLPFEVSRADVLAQVPIQRGAIQMIPVRADGSPAGTAPEMIHLP